MGDRRVVDQSVGNHGDDGEQEARGVDRSKLESVSVNARSGVNGFDQE